MLASMANNINVRVLPTAEVDTSFTVLSAATKYVAIGGSGSRVHSAQLIWHDATTAGDITIESTNQPDADIDSADDKVWSLEGDISTINIPGGADGSVMIHIGNSGAVRYRLKFVATANSEISCWICGK